MRFIRKRKTTFNAPNHFIIVPDKESRKTWPGEQLPPNMKEVTITNQFRVVTYEKINDVWTLTKDQECKVVVRTDAQRNADHFVRSA